MNSENIKIISSKIDRETKEGKIVIEVEEVPDSIKRKIEYMATSFRQTRFVGDGEGNCLIEGFINGAEYGYQISKDSNQVNPNQILSDKARDHAKEVEKFYSPTIEAYMLRAKNSFEAGYNSAKEEILNCNDDPDNKYLPGRLDFYREQMKKLREYLNENNIGKPNQNFFDAMYDHIKQLEWAKEIPDEVVYRTVKGVDRLPAKDQKIFCKVENGFENHWCSLTYKFGNYYFRDFPRDTLSIPPEKIEWIEPISLKDLLAK